jgi:hypothetical protein
MELIRQDSILRGLCIACSETNVKLQSFKSHNNKSYSAYTTYKDACTHKGSPLVFSYGEGWVRAGGDRNWEEWDLTDVQLIVSLNGVRSPSVVLNKEAAGLLPQEQYPSIYPAYFPRVSINWEDRGAPPVGAEFIQDLLRFVHAGGKILVHCTGGHGRTGTMLVAMMHLAGLIPEGVDGVKHIRSIYCEDAVESTKQTTWLGELGVKITADTETSVTFGGVIVNGKAK